MPKRAKQESLDLVERRGFNGNNATVSLVLIDADVERAAAAVKKCGKCATWRKGVYGKRVRAAKAGSVYTGFASSSAAHQCRIIGWFTGSGATWGLPIGFPIALRRSRTARCSASSISAMLLAHAPSRVVRVSSSALRAMSSTTSPKPAIFGLSAPPLT